MVLGSHVVLFMKKPVFLEIYIFAPKKMKMGQKKVFLNLLENFEGFHHLLYFCVNPIFGKNQVPKILAKMRSANQLAEFLNHLYHEN